MSDLSGLLERVKAATGPDRRIDAWIAVKVAMPSEWNWQIRENPDLIKDLSIYTQKAIPPYSESVDLCLALVERCGFPLGQGQWNYTMAAAYGSFSIIPNDGESTGIHDKRCGHAHGAATIPIAILSALLAALIAKETSHDNH